MKERPILFSAPMVRAILQGRKTQTRRVVKRTIEGSPYRSDWLLLPGEVNKRTPPCPYGKRGDRLWVRENYWAVELDGHGIGNQFLVYDEEWSRPGGGNPAPTELRPMRELRRWGKHPSIHMPRWASRITLEITGVRVERLRELSEADAEAEGMPAQTGAFVHHVVADYRKLWSKINGAESWDTNPWVWVIEFKRVKP